jgi:hypothetical protein
MSDNRQNCPGVKHHMVNGYDDDTCCVCGQPWSEGHCERAPDGHSMTLSSANCGNAGCEHDLSALFRDMGIPLPSAD